MFMYSLPCPHNLAVQCDCTEALHSLVSLQQQLITSLYQVDYIDLKAKDKGQNCLALSLSVHHVTASKPTCLLPALPQQGSALLSTYPA